MINWYMTGYFGENVLMKTENDEYFYPLLSWIINCNNQVSLYIFFCINKNKNK